ncbi:MAG: hypothetical protein Fur0025_11000 [Oscillatoriaceae cyanobacterium]
MDIVLVVDDNPTNIKVLFEFLKGFGYKVLVAKNGEDALEKAKQALPHIILLDIMMPGIDGFETCRRLKLNPDLQDIPVIFMTALSDTVNKVKGLSLGAVDYITKPFQQEEVLARLQLHLKLSSLTKMLAYQNELLEQKVAERTAQLSQSLESLQQAQVQLVQSEKMSTLGQLSAGIAHEINNPISFLAGNLDFLKSSINHLIEHLQLYQEALPVPGEKIQQHARSIELEYLLEDAKQMLESMKEGTDRLRQISHSMRTLSRSDTANKVTFHVHEGIDSTLMILKHRLKATPERPEIKVIKNYGDIPGIKCYPGQLNQVFMNLLANAIDAIEETTKQNNLDAIKSQPYLITISTAVDPNSDTIAISFKDNGMGIPYQAQEHLFEQLFTTKPPGKGTGLGLSISRQIIVDKHGGKLQCISAPGQGAEFRIELPIK